jgi:hypothetical protein
VLLPKQAVALHGGMDLVIASQSFALEMMRRWFISAAEAGIHPGRIWMLPQV